MIALSKEQIIRLHSKLLKATGGLDGILFQQKVKKPIKDKKDYFWTKKKPHGIEP